MLGLIVKVVTLFPEMFPGPLGSSISGRALKEKKWFLETYDIKKHAINKRVIDDTPYGGGSGLVIRPDVISKAYDYSIKDIKIKSRNKWKFIIYVKSNYRFT